MRSAGRVAGLGAVLLVVAGCGVPLSDSAQPLPGAGRTRSPSATTTQNGVGSAIVWYVDGGRLVPRAVASPQPVSPEVALDLLSAVPAGSRGLETLIDDPLGGPPLASLPQASSSPQSASAGQAPERQVVLSQTFNELAGQDQVLLIGQLVLTLTETDRAPISFVDASSSPLSVPLPDGRLRDGPVTRGDYISLT